jgi:poly-gamma-glutamate synthesis protein (capsule biosynthesis protein)
VSAHQLSVLLAGDMLIARPWSRVEDPAFLAMIARIRAADVAIANLETVIHDFHGFPQADSGGTYAHTPPDVAKDVRWAGFTLLSHANNHAFDYGSTGVLETHQHAAAAGLMLAGSGADLDGARAPRFVYTAHGSVGLVAMVATFPHYGRASRARADAPGRPGVNPLRLQPAGRFIRTPHIMPGDADGNLGAIADAARQSDCTIASIHTHTGGMWLREYSRRLVDGGADIVFVHGAHDVGPIEFYRGTPIFHSLGDFVYEPDQMLRQPSDAYDRLGLGADASARDLFAAPGFLKALDESRSAYEGCLATCLVEEGVVRRIRLDPVDLQFDDRAGARGRPRSADATTGRRIIDSIAARSRQFSVRVRYDPAGSFGEIIPA